MASFLDRFAVGGRFGVAGGMLARAKAAGYSDKQIAVAINKYSGNLKIGQALRPGSARHTQMATSTAGRPGNWAFHHMGPSGAIGVGGLSSALMSGRTKEDLVAAGGLMTGGTKNYGIPGFGQGAASYLSQIPDAPEELEFSLPEWEMPGSHMGGGRVLGTSALGVRSNLGSQDRTGGVGDAFNRDKIRQQQEYAAQFRIDPLG